MLLTVDVGNSQTVLATFDGDRRVGCWRVTTAPRATSDELHMLWRGLLRDAVVTGVSACSTVPALLPALRQLLDSLEVPVVLIGPGVRTGVPLHVDNPREVGADRVVTALAAHELFGRAPDGSGRPVVVVDFGTSTNVDAVGPEGQFLGGALAPGVEVSLEALATRAAQLRSVELTVPPHAIGKNTVAALQSGLVLGFAGLVDGLVTRIAGELVAQFGAAPVVVGTGGLAPLVADSCRSITEREPDLTVHGLRLAFERHQAAAGGARPAAPPAGGRPRGPGRPRGGAS
ncbi:type III pantothenate kinase [Geodermatophilus sp. SYSU D00758]